MRGGWHLGFVEWVLSHPDRAFDPFGVGKTNKGVDSSFNHGLIARGYSDSTPAGLIAFNRKVDSRTDPASSKCIHRTEHQNLPTGMIAVGQAGLDPATRNFIISFR